MQLDIIYLYCIQLSVLRLCDAIHKLFLYTSIVQERDAWQLMGEVAVLTDDSQICLYSLQTWLFRRIVDTFDTFTKPFNLKYDTVQTTYDLVILVELTMVFFDAIKSRIKHMWSVDDVVNQETLTSLSQ